MNLLKFKAAIIISLCLSLSALFATSISTAAISESVETEDIYAALFKAFGVSESTYNDYDSLYKDQTNRIEYVKTDTPGYLALGGETASGYGATTHSDGYADRFASYLGYEYGATYYNKAAGTLLASNVVEYINKREIKPLIEKVDIISLQLDSSPFINEMMNLFPDFNINFNWGKYNLGEEFYEALDAYRASCIEFYGTKISGILECFLYECTEYCIETANAIKEIQKLNPNATIAVLGLYNPIRGLKISAGGNASPIDRFFVSAIDFCNVYLLDKTRNLSKVVFVDLSGVHTKGFNETLAINDLPNPSEFVKNTYDNRFADQAGHNDIYTALTAVVKNHATHNLTSENILSEPNCTEGGKTELICTTQGCSYTEIKATAPLGHFICEEIIEEASCVANGEILYTCNNCSYKEVAIIEPLGHDLSEKPITLPTCTEEGKSEFTCLREGCGYAEIINTGLTEHETDVYTSNNDATCKTAGTLSASCIKCGKSFTVEDPTGPLEHKYDDNGVCIYCNDGKASDELPTDHTATVVIIVVLTICMAGGVTYGVLIIKKKDTKKSPDSQKNDDAEQNDAKSHALEEPAEEQEKVKEEN